MTEALGDQILEYLDMNWASVLGDVERHALAAGLSIHLEPTEPRVYRKEEA
jgi:hypothetical protein